MKSFIAQEFVLTRTPGLPTIKFYLTGQVTSQSPLLVGKPIYCPAFGFLDYPTWVLSGSGFAQNVVSIGKAALTQGNLTDVAWLPVITDANRKVLESIGSWFINCCISSTVRWCHFEMIPHFTNFAANHGEPRKMHPFELEGRFFQELLKITLN